MKRICLLAVALGALTLPATAGAKEVTGAKVCGASGCKETTDAEVLKPFSMSEENGVAPKETFNAPVGSYYTVNVSYGDNGQTVGTHLSYWLSGPRLMHGSDQGSFDPWWELTEAQNAGFESVAAGIQPFQPDLSRVLVGGKSVTDPSSYIRLFAHYPLPFRTVPKKARWISISVRPAHANPWVQKAVRLRYQPERRILARPDGWVLLPKAIGTLLVRRASLATVKTGSGGGHTALYAGAGAAGAVAVVLLAAVRTKRMH